MKIREIYGNHRLEGEKSTKSSGPLLNDLSNCIFPFNIWRKYESKSSHAPSLSCCSLKEHNYIV